MVIKTDLDALVIELENWLKTQPQLPQKIEKPLLKRFLHSVYGNVEGAQRLIEHNYSLRNKHPHIFLTRDPTDAASQQLLQVADLLPLPGLTPEKNKLLMYRLSDYDAEKFNFTDSIKVFFMVGDCRFIVEDESEIAEGEIPIFDMAGYTLRHLTKTVFSVLRVYMKFTQEAHPVRLKQIHMLNCPSYVDKVMTVIKPFMKNEVAKLLHFHLPNSDTPYKYFPREMMPEEYGGRAGKMADLRKQWNNTMQQQREYLMDNQRWQMDKTKKPRNTNTISTTMPEATNGDHLQSSFRTLDID